MVQYNLDYINNLEVDFRKFHEKIIDDKYSIPIITNLLDKLERCQYFTNLNSISGFRRIVHILYRITKYINNLSVIFDRLEQGSFKIQFDKSFKH